MSWFSSGIKNIVGDERYSTISSLFTAGVAEKITGIKTFQPFFEEAEAQKIDALKNEYMPFVYLCVAGLICYFVLRK